MSIVVVMLLATSNSAPAAWEYKVLDGVRYGYILQNRINDAAKEGWEVVGVATDTDRGPMAVMRRPKAVQRSAWWKFWKK